VSHTTSEILEYAKTVAVVGASRDPGKPSGHIPYLLQHRGFRYVEALVVGLILMIAGCFAIELWLAKPVMTDVAAGFIPTTGVLRDPNMLYIAIGILGATVMPHNLYLHSSIVQTRRYADTAVTRSDCSMENFVSV